MSVRNVSSGDLVEVAPILAVDQSNKILSVGEPSDPAAVRVLSPFQHPRVLIEDFVAGEKIIQYAIKELFGMGPIAPSPIVVIHPDLELDGGLTFIEARALREMAEGAGARKVLLHYGRQLTDQEVSNLSFDEFGSVA